MNSVYLWSRARLAVNKKQNYFSLPDHQLAENLILVFGFYERTKKGWKWICNYICSNFSYDHFQIKISLKLFVKSFLHTVSSLITWNRKPWTKQLVQHRQKILANYMHISRRALQLLWLFFEKYLAKYFWSLLNSPNSIFQLLLCESNVNKTA